LRIIIRIEQVSEIRKEKVMKKQSLSYHKSHSTAFAQIKMIPTVIWQTCRACQQDFKTSEMKFVNNECEHCQPKAAHTAQERI